MERARPVLITTKQNATDVLNTAGIFLQGNWPNGNYLIYLAKGISMFGSQIEARYDSSVNGLRPIRSMLPNGSVNWYWKEEKDRSNFFNPCGWGEAGACALNEGVEFYKVVFDNTTPFRIATVAVHKIAHIIRFSCNVSAATP